MNTQVQLRIDDSGNPIEVLDKLGKGIKALAKLIPNNKNETEDLTWLMQLLAGGVTDIAAQIRR